jgi:dynein light intermediate chain 2
LKNICNVWELGSLANSNQLIEVPFRQEGLANLSVVIIVDLSQPDRIWTDLECILTGLKQAYSKNCNETDVTKKREETKEKIGLDHPDLSTLELLPFPVVIIGGRYDIFQDLDPEIKKHVCRLLRSVAHTIGAALVFYSNKNAALAKIVRDTLNHLGFTSPANPFKATTVDYNGPIVIPFGGDSWEKIGVTPTNSERFGLMYSSQIPQIGQGVPIMADDPAKDPGFLERVIDDMRALREEELMRVLRDTEIRMKFETVQ